jgi:hypothetical protein
MGKIRSSIQDDTPYSFDKPQSLTGILVDDITRKVIIKKREKLTIIDYIEYNEKEKNK